MNNLNFRAWHKELKEMEKVLLMCLVNEYVDVLPLRNLEGGSQEAWSFKDIVLMQSTGLKDSKGVEIFEGDIVLEEYGVGYESKYYPSFANNNQNKTKNLVEIKSGLILPYFGECSDDNFYKVFTVLGNLYEKPELLGGGV